MSLVPGEEDRCSKCVRLMADKKQQNFSRKDLDRAHPYDL